MAIGTSRRFGTWGSESGLTEIADFATIRDLPDGTTESNLPAILASGIGEQVQDYWPILVIGLIILAVIALWYQLRTPPLKPYQRRGELITKAELRFYRALEVAVRGELRIFSMVRIADLLKVAPEVKSRQSWQNRINCKHIDFVLCDPETLEVLVCLELDDASHQRKDRIERDEFVNAAFESAGLPLIRVPLQSTYDLGQLRQAIEEALK